MGPRQIKAKSLSKNTRSLWEKIWLKQTSNMEEPLEALQTKKKLLCNPYDPVALEVIQVVLFDFLEPSRNFQKQKLVPQFTREGLTRGVDKR